jgi:hypothetical protein
LAVQKNEIPTEKKEPKFRFLAYRQGETRSLYKKRKKKVCTPEGKRAKVTSVGWKMWSHQVDWRMWAERAEDGGTMSTGTAEKDQRTQPARCCAACAWLQRRGDFSAH